MDRDIYIGFLKAKRIISISSDKAEILKKYPPVVSSIGGFYNPTHTKYGEFFLKTVGTFKKIFIVFEGEITSILKNEKLKGCELKFSRDNPTIEILNKNPDIEVNEELLFNFTGDIYRIKHATVNGWWRNKIYSEVVDYDQTHIPIEKNKTKLEDDNYKFTYDEEEYHRYDPLPLLKENTSRNRFSKKLPKNYIENTRDILDLDKDLGFMREKEDNCRTCFHWKNNYCDHWGAPVKSYGWCVKWKIRGRR